MLLQHSELKSKIKQLRASAKERNIVFSLSLKDLERLYKSQDNCFYFGTPLIKGTISVDRKDNTKGYIVGNVVLCHKKANDLKNQLFENSVTRVSNQELTFFFNTLIKTYDSKTFID